jgi:hypothetical protein
MHLKGIAISEFLDSSVSFIVCRGRGAMIVELDGGRGVHVPKKV